MTTPLHTFISSARTGGSRILIAALLPLLVLATGCAFILQKSLHRIRHAEEQQIQADGQLRVHALEHALQAALAEELKTAADHAQAQVFGIYKDALDNDWDMETAQKTALDQLRHTQNTEAISFHILDTKGVILLHSNPAVEGKNLLQEARYSHAWPAVQQQISQKTGNVDSIPSLTNPGQTPPRSAYLAFFPPWNWVISASCPPDKLAHNIALVDSLRKINAQYADKPGTLILLDPAPETGADAEPTALAAQPGEGTSGTEEHLLWRYALPRYAITIGLSVPKEQVHAAFFEARRTTLLLLVGLTLVTGAAMALLAQRLRPSTQIPLSPQAAATGGAGENSLVKTSSPQSAHIPNGEEHPSPDAFPTRERTRLESAERFLGAYKKIINSAEEGFCIMDPHFRILSINAAFTRLTGYTAAESLGRTAWLLEPDQQDTDEFLHTLKNALTERSLWEGEAPGRSKDGSARTFRLVIHAIRNGGEPVCYLALFSVKEKPQAPNQQGDIPAHHDPLTRLPNRTILELRMDQALKHAETARQFVGVLFIDLDRFKNINDVFGHQQGDLLLIQVSRRFSAILGEHDSLYRQGSDEFILLMEQVDNEASVHLMANRIHATLKEPFQIDRQTVYIDTCVGISIYPTDGASSMELIRGADTAMHRAKQEGGNKHVLFSREMHRTLSSQFQIENDIRTGLANREFTVFYQPKVVIASRQTSSLEALIRWKRGDTLLPPGQFIPVAEESGLIDELCLVVLEKTCAFFTDMDQNGVKVPVSVNISPRQFSDRRFVDRIEDMLQRYQVAPHFLEFEITETTAMENVEHTLAVMLRLQELGINFSIDDFGTGYSSLAYLAQMPVSTLKIDKQFIDDLDTNSGIIATIIAISQQMNLNVVAEGVETEAQLHALASMGCNEVQGYLFSRPVPGEEILLFLEQERRAVIREAEARRSPSSSGIRP
ncbi:MAG: EAL domain-containing protein [Desulfobulbus sp.]|jgi:diguanylate cyclase (GGDEF)-like protein/PAS domain S-box-containing protein